MKIKKKTNKYFEYFEKKKLNYLEQLFHNNIELLDPDNIIKGKNKVLIFNRKLFTKFKKIKIKVIHQAINEKKKNSFSYIKVTLDGKIFHIVDFLQFSRDEKLKKIIAFKK